MKRKQRLNIEWERSPEPVPVSLGPRRRCSGSPSSPPTVPKSQELGFVPRLPGIDPGIRRSEAAVFASLGLAAVTMISLTVSSSMKFAENRQEIIARTSSERPPLGATNVEPSKTNVAVAPPQPFFFGKPAPATSNPCCPAVQSL